MITIICSTNRMDSVSSKISQQYARLLDKKGIQNQTIDLKDLPNDFAFSALYDKSGKNEAFNHYRKVMKECKKFVFVVPEYNGSFPGVLKTFIDGLEFPNTFTNKKCAMVGLSSGIQGAGLALSHLTDIFNYCGMNVLAQKVKLAKIEANTDDDYNITNQLYNQLLKEQVDLLIQF